MSTEPRIQYAKTSDGVNIAYCSMGEGLPLVIVPVFPTSHVEFEWRLWPDFYQALARSFRLIRVALSAWFEIYRGEAHVGYWHPSLQERIAVLDRFASASGVHFKSSRIASWPLQAT